MCGVSSNVFSYLRRISDVRVAYLAYQWRMCYVCATFVSLLWSMCDVLGVNRNILWRSKRILMLLHVYVCFRFSEVMDQMFLTVRGFHGYAWCSLRLCSCGLTTRMESLKMFPHHHHHHHHHHLGFFSVLI